MTTTVEQAESSQAPSFEQLQTIIADVFNGRLTLSEGHYREYPRPVLDGALTGPVLRHEETLTDVLPGWFRKLAGEFLAAAERIDIAAGFEPGINLYAFGGHERRVSCNEFPDLSFVVYDTDSDAEAVEKARTALEALIASRPSQPQA